MIDAKDITKVYNQNSRKANMVLEHADISFPDKGFVFIVGKSGIGKSTILNALGGLISYDGSILFDGKEVDLEKYRRKNIGYIFQDFLLFDELSVRDNIRIGLNIAGIYDEQEITKRVSVLLKAVGLNINSKRSARALSLGQRQRVAIARALASNPKVILADEPTGNLDSKNSINVMRILKSLSKNHLVICVTHNMNLVHLFADEAFCIIDRKFKKVDPKTEKVDESYVKNTINVSTLSRKDLEDEHILFKIYSDDSTEKNEITIIRRGGKIVVLGDNISLASKEDIDLIHQEEKKEKNDTNSEPVPVDVSSDGGFEELNFDNTDKKHSFKDTTFFKRCKEVLSLENFMTRKKEKFFHKAAMLIPVVVYTAIAISTGLISTVKESYSPIIHKYMDNVLVATNDGNQDIRVNRDDILDLIQDPDAHIVETQSLLNTYNTFGYLSNTDRNSYGDGYYITEGSNSLSNGYVSLRPENFDVFTKGKDSMGGYSYANVTFSDISRYQGLVGELKGVTLKDNEIIVDSKIFERMDADQIEFLEGDFRSNVIGSKLRMNLNDNGAFSRKIEYVIKDVVDTGLFTIYCTKNTADRMRVNSFVSMRQRNGFSSSFDSFDIVDFSTIDPSKYVFYHETNGKETEIPYSEIQQDFAENLGGYRDFLSMGKRFPFCGIASKDVLNFTQSSYKVGSLFDIYSLGDFITTDYILVKDKASPDKRVIVLQDYSDQSGNMISSRKNFEVNNVLGNLSLNSRFDDSSEVSLSVPSQLYSEENKKELESILVDNFGFPVTVKSIEGTRQDPVVLSQGLIDQMLCSSLWNLTLTGKKSVRFGDDVDVANFSFRNYFLSDDVEKTKAYLKEHSDIYPFVLRDYSVVRDKYIDSALNQMFLILVSIVTVLLLVMALILVLQNVGRINKEKYRFGVLRCLGMSRAKILLDDSVNVFFEFVFACLVPTLLLSLILAVTNLFFMGWFYLLYLLLVFLVYYLSSEIPLMLTLMKKPYQILKNLN